MMKHVMMAGVWFTYYYLPGTDHKSRLQYGGSGSAYYTYEPNRDLLTQVRNHINGGVISQYDYVNDAAGRRTAITRSGSMMSETRTDYYGYNDRSELVSGTKDTAATNLTEYAYQYDDIGNRLSSLDLGTNRTYTANGLNQYTSITGSVGDSPAQTESFTPTFDLDGNQILIRTSTGDWSVTYNAENRPVLWSCGTTNIVMSFDRMGRRVEYLETVADTAGGTQFIASVTTNSHHRFVYEITAAQAGRAQWALQAERTERSEEAPREPRYLCIQRLDAAANNAIDLAFGWDPTEPVATRPLWIQRPTGNYNFFCFHDGNKNVSDVVSYQSAYGVAAHYEYAPFGAVTVAINCDPPASTAFSAASTNLFRFSSEYADDALGLMYYNYRHYDPMHGRWLGRDPMEEKHGINLQAFIKNSIFEVDVLGLSGNGVCCQDFLDKVNSGAAGGAGDLRYDILNLNLAAAGIGNGNHCKITVKCEKCSSDISRNGRSSNMRGYAQYNERSRLFVPNDIEISISICTDDAGRTLSDLDRTAATLNHELIHANDMCKQKKDFDCGEFTLVSLNAGVLDSRICSELRAYARQNRGLGEGLDKKSVIERAVESVLLGCKIGADKHVDGGFAFELAKRVESMYDRCCN